jgi:two-component system chemotaxis sensor kinase CheA
MDVVRAAAERLGGTVDLRTAPGQGTTLELRAPVSLAAFDALIVESRGRAVAVPTDATRLAVRLAAAEVVRTAGREAIVVGGDLVPSIPLARVLRGASSDSPLAGAAAVVVDGRGATAALTFERAVGVERVVMRPLPAGTPADPVVAGVCLGVDGSTRLLLDADELVALARSGAWPSPAEPAAPPAPPRLPILVVDDSLTSRMLEQSTLESAGYEVDVASSGEEGFEKAHARRYALFLVDVEMPGMDGFEFVARASADPALRHIPAILVTSRGSTEDRRRGEAAGARAHIVKSEFDHRVLLDLIRSLLA